MAFDCASSDVALQTRNAFESSEEYRKMNKTQRRKAMQQWEAENEHIMEALRAEGKEPKAEAAPKLVPRPAEAPKPVEARKAEQPAAEAPKPAEEAQKEWG